MTGFSGRVAIHEVLEISEEMRSVISNSEPIYKLQQAAKEIGCMSLRQDALKKAILGLMTIEEVERTTVPEYSLYTSASAQPPARLSAAQVLIAVHRTNLDSR